MQKKDKRNYELKEDNDTKLAQKEKNNQVLDLQEHTDKKILKLSILIISAHLDV